LGNKKLFKTPDYISLHHPRTVKTLNSLWKTVPARIKHPSARIKEINDVLGKHD
jgi:hypothetical protein